jgi:hypothetical protein
VIPRNFITEWRAEAPWIQDAQVEQDLVLSRALVELFSATEIREAVVAEGWPRRMFLPIGVARASYE